MPKAQAVDITKKTKRVGLQPQAGNAPYFRKVREGQFIGYRPSTVISGTGSWVARYRADDGKYRTEKLGEFGEFDDALIAAEKFFVSAKRGVFEVRKITVNEACKRYVTALRGEQRDSSANDAEARFKRIVEGSEIGEKPLAQLRPEHMREWFAGLLQERLAAGADMNAAKSSCNRNLASVKAALNLALADQLVSDGHAWVNVKPHKGVSNQKEGSYLSKPERKRLLNKGCSSTYAELDDDGNVTRRFEKTRYADNRYDLKKFLTFLTLSGIRPGAAAAMKARHWDGRVLTVEHDKAGAGRKFRASERLRRVLDLCCKGLAPEEYIFTRAGKTSRSDSKSEVRKPFDKDFWTGSFERAAARAGVVGTVYSLRHSAITDMVADGLPIAVIAFRVGTSIAMIEKHYAHLNDKNLEELAAINY